MLKIQAKDFNRSAQIEEFVNQLKSVKYLRDNMVENQAVVVTEVLPRQLDPLEKTEMYVPFTVECRFKGKEDAQ